MGSLDAILAAVQSIHSAPITVGGWTTALSSAAAASRSENVFLVSGRPAKADVAVVGIGRSLKIWLGSRPLFVRGDCLDG